ncbi:hypothetical protein QFZ32_002092 [Streptomyces canus]|nr:hypothetical protein [Streptomyces canus]
MPLIRSHRIGAAVVSPLQRARETTELIGLHDLRVDVDLRWGHPLWGRDYGGYEGVTTVPRGCSCSPECVREVELVRSCDGRLPGLRSPGPIGLT